MRGWRIPPSVLRSVPQRPIAMSLAHCRLRLSPEVQETGFRKRNGEWSDPGAGGPGIPGSLHSPHARPLLADPFGAIGSRASLPSHDVSSPMSRRTIPCP
jgi:hypothetical protein